MKWIIPTLLILAACGGREVTETTVSTTTTTPTAGTSAAGGGAAVAGASGTGLDVPDGTGSGVPIAAGGATLLAADAVAYACLSDEQKALVGQPISVAMPVLPENARILRPDSLYTQDYRPNRINADVDGKEMVTRVWCG
ncbi:MAG: I78 family peptidase inhibitor [Arenibacterium sp.]